MAALASALDVYAEQFGNLPADGTNFVTELLAKEIIERPIRDAWGNAIILEQTEFSLKSMGEDGKLGTVDDQIITKK